MGLFKKGKKHQGDAQAASIDDFDEEAGASKPSRGAVHKAKKVKNEAIEDLAKNLKNSNEKARKELMEGIAEGNIELVNKAAERYLKHHNHAKDVREDHMPRLIDRTADKNDIGAMELAINNVVKFSKERSTSRQAVKAIVILNRLIALRGGELPEGLDPQKLKELAEAVKNVKTEHYFAQQEISETAIILPLLKNLKKYGKDHAQPELQSAVVNTLLHRAENIVKNTEVKADTDEKVRDWEARRKTVILDAKRELVGTINRFLVSSSSQNLLENSESMDLVLSLLFHSYDANFKQIIFGMRDCEPMFLALSKAITPANIDQFSSGIITHMKDGINKIEIIHRLLTGFASNKRKYVNELSGSDETVKAKRHKLLSNITALVKETSIRGEDVDRVKEIVQLVLPLADRSQKIQLAEALARHSELIEFADEQLGDTSKLNAGQLAELNLEAQHDLLFVLSRRVFESTEQSNQAMTTILNLVKAKPDMVEEYYDNIVSKVDQTHYKVHQILLSVLLSGLLSERSDEASLSFLSELIKATEFNLTVVKENEYRSGDVAFHSALSLALRNDQSAGKLAQAALILAEWEKQLDKGKVSAQDVQREAEGIVKSFSLQKGANPEQITSVKDLTCLCYQALNLEIPVELQATAKEEKGKKKKKDKDKDTATATEKPAKAEKPKKKKRVAAAEASSSASVEQIQVVESVQVAQSAAASVIEPAPQSAVMSASDAVAGEAPKPATPATARSAVMKETETASMRASDSVRDEVVASAPPQMASDTVASDRVVQEATITDIAVNLEPANEQPIRWRGVTDWSRIVTLDDFLHWLDANGQYPRHLNAIDDQGSSLLMELVRRGGNEENIQMIRILSQFEGVDLLQNNGSGLSPLALVVSLYQERVLGQEEAKQMANTLLEAYELRTDRGQAAKIENELEIFSDAFDLSMPRGTRTAFDCLTKLCNKGLELSRGTALPSKMQTGEVSEASSERNQQRADQMRNMDNEIKKPMSRFGQVFKNAFDKMFGMFGGSKKESQQEVAQQAPGEHEQRLQNQEQIEQRRRR